MSEKKQQAAYPLRMTPSLREAVERAAHESKRSVNAEIVSRLELSLIADQQLTDFISADQARKIAELAGTNIAKKLRDSVQAEILSAATNGVGGLMMSTDGLGLDTENETHRMIMDEIIRDLREAGYNARYTPHFEIDISFWPDDEA
ncbi:Arc family DNA-binding protein [Pseudomonas kurunegalensis]|uniref:Arc family DNA-binding protein n=1 Tax=Pseudomonas kurunegalensis TaxID=485880 RepID=A0ACC5UKK6_9PSED|nr:Arc family DNA-binding protein [Pseudomonas kurunegalensis]MBV4514930.1 Arc family DNA-binding protein [Pseudomonas kurunegalensis]